MQYKGQKNWQNDSTFKGGQGTRIKRPDGCSRRQMIFFVLCLISSRSSLILWCSFLFSASISTNSFSTSIGFSSILSKRREYASSTIAKWVLTLSRRLSRVSRMAWWATRKGKKKSSGASRKDIRQPRRRQPAYTQPLTIPMGLNDLIQNLGDTHLLLLRQKQRQFTYSFRMNLSFWLHTRSMNQFCLLRKK